MDILMGVLYLILFAFILQSYSTWFVALQSLVPWKIGLVLLILSSLSLYQYRYSQEGTGIN